MTACRKTVNSSGILHYKQLSTWTSSGSLLGSWFWASMRYFPGAKERIQDDSGRLLVLHNEEAQPVDVGALK